MGVGGRRRRPIATASGRGLALGVLAAGLACATPWSLEGGRWRHRERGYSIEAPGAGWQPVEVSGADLAFQRPEGAMLTLATRCHTPLAEPRILARHLVIGLHGPIRRASRAVRVDGHAGWLERWDVQGPGGARQLETVTAVVAGCVVDFVLLESVPPGSQADFERWWGSFRWPAGEEEP